ncbi:heparinase II/III family protein [Labrys wisconsinensis]|uniref:Heparinase superfamily protein n=1 Tax=Labrys wisconsinensis TaxID=425677 RepID=A0ABU0JHV5_9HYPH|nr:heparinase II/III family protein [Labrys wisconsinensis]MDQ0473871.1 putative heparinase superfamily protein [Labrys wisconsinensis]
MSRSGIGTKVRLGLLAGRNAGRSALARLYTSRLYRWRFGSGRPERLLLAPQDLRAADPTRAEEIIQNRFTFAGKTVVLKDASPFAIPSPSPAWSEGLLGFTWLRHLRTVQGLDGHHAARRLVADFVRGPARFGQEALRPVTAARRVVSWLSQSPLVLEGADRGFYRAFIRSITWQTHYLLSAGRVGPDGLPRLLCAMAATQASLCLAEKGGLRRRATRWLVDELQRQVLADGVHRSRNPQATVELLLDLLPLRQSFAARNLPPPPELLGAIDRLMPMLRFFRHADGAFAAFNGMGYTQSHLIATLLAYDDARGKPVQNAPHGGYQRVEGSSAVLLVDTGRPPALSMSHEAHAGTLSFEFSADGARIIVNCGAPAVGRDSWRQLARATAAHSTAVVAEASSCRFAPLGPSERPVIAGPKTVTLERRETPDAITLAASHDGYKAAFGLVHERVLTLSPRTGALAGRDAMLDRAGQAWRGRETVLLRFHVHPAVGARPGGGDRFAALTLPNGKVWRLRADGLPLAIEESIHFANPEGPRRATQIVVVVPRDDGGASLPVSWSLEPETR